MVKVEYYETATARKSGDCLGVFSIKTTPEAIPEVDENLKGKTTSSGKDLYELAVEQRKERVAKATAACIDAALDKVRSIVGSEGVLVARLEDVSETDEVVAWILEHKTLAENFKAKFPELYKKYQEVVSNE